MDPSSFPLSNPLDSWGVWIFAACIGVVYGVRTYFGGPECRSGKSLKGKVAIVCGVRDGSVGEQVALDFAKRGAAVVISGRDVGLGTASEIVIKKRAENDVVQFIPMDLLSLKSVAEFVADFTSRHDRLDILVNSAGVMMPPFDVSAEGFEAQFQTNFLGPHFLTQSLLPLLKKSAATSPEKETRIVNVTCRAFELAECLDLSTVRGESLTETSYKRGESYTRSKVAFTMASLEMSRRLEGTGVTLNLVHPGVVNTHHGRHTPFFANLFLKLSLYPFFWLMTKSAFNGAQTVIFCAVAETVKGVTGKYFVDLFETEIEGIAKDVEATKAVVDHADKWISQADKTE